MKIECTVTVNKKVVTVTLEGEFETIVELLQKAGFDLVKAQELELK